MGEKTPTRQIFEWLAALDAALQRGDVAGAAALFGDDCYWRDLVSFSWNITTAEGSAKVRQLIEGAVIPARPSGWKLEGDASDADGVAEGWFTFETTVARGYGHVRLKNGKAFTLLTTMTELKGSEEQKGPTRDFGATHSYRPGGNETWLQKRQKEEAELGITTQPYVVIVGGGQGGIMLAARLKQLNVPTIIVEKNERPGDSWRNRYKSLYLHDPIWYDHLPYIPFPDIWPIFSSKDKIGDWLEMYTKVLELNFWGSAECRKASYDQKKKEWTVEVVRNGKPVTLRPRQLVIATGGSGFPNVPVVPGQERFKGVVQHSSEHTGPEGFKGKKAVVIGSNNSAHDIAAAFWEEGGDVTMVQRSSTLVARGGTIGPLTLGVLYSEDAVAAGITHEKADYIFATTPYKLMPAEHKPAFDKLQELDADLYSRLKKVGFMLDFGEDGSGILVKQLRRGSGYYIDVGASELIADGRIKLHSAKGLGVERFEENGIVLTDGTKLPADIVVFATGYGSMDGWVEKLISPAVADKVGKIWGLGSETTRDPGPWEGEVRNMWKPTQQEGLWFMGGNIALARFYSQFLAMQLKARMEGLATPVYGLPPAVHAATY